MLPPRIHAPKREKVRRVFQKHRKWVRLHRCCVPGCDRKPIDFAHVRNGTDGGTGLKPHDRWGISLCEYHHRHEQHQIGERAFEIRYGIDMKALASEFASKSPDMALRRAMKKE